MRQAVGLSHVTQELCVDAQARTQAGRKLSSGVSADRGGLAYAVPPIQV